MKKFLITLSIAACASLYSLGDTMVKVSGDNEALGEFLLADSPSVKPTAQGLEITAGTAKLVLPMDQTYSFTIQEGAGITEIEAQAVSISREASSVTVHGLNDGETISAFTIDGKLIGSSVAANGTATISLTSAKGIIIISTSTQTFKIIK